MATKSRSIITRSSNPLDLRVGREEINYACGDVIAESPILRAGFTSTGPLTSSTDPAVLRDALASAVKAGNVKRVEFEATVSFDTVNANFMRPAPEEYADFAKTFARAGKARPFLYDHLGKMAARKGSIIESGSESIIAPKGGFIQAMKQTIALTRADAIVDYVEGGIESFSIGWQPEWYECSACKADIMGCGHWPGDPIEGSKEKVHFITHGNVGLETSAVVFPAWEGTQPDALRLVAAFREMRSIPSGTIVAEGEGRMDEKIRMALGLANDATVEEAVAKIESLNAAAGEATILTASMKRLATLAGVAGEGEETPTLAVEEAVAARFAAEVVTREEMERVEAESKRREIRAAIDAARKDGKITAAQTKWAEEYGMANGIERLNAFLAKQGRQVPVAVDPPTGTQRTETAAAGVLTAEDRRVIELTGVSEADFVKEKTAMGKRADAVVAAVLSE